MGLKLDTYTVLDGITVIKVEGEFDVYTAPRIRNLTLDLFKAGSKRLIFDLSLVEFLDSTGEGVLIGALKRARARGHDRPFALVVPDERIKKGFRIHGTTKVFAMFDDISAAIAYMSDDPVQIDAALDTAVVDRYLGSSSA